jgi:hypothetical protein
MPMALLLLAWTAAALLVAAEFSTLYEVRVVSAVPEGGRHAAGPHHGYALLPVAAAIAVMAFGAARGGSRAAAAAVVALAAVALFVALAVDLPVTDDTGLIGRTYDLARADRGAAVALELAGAGLALIAGLGLLFTRPERRARYQR